MEMLYLIQTVEGVAKTFDVWSQEKKQTFRLQAKNVYFNLIRTDLIVTHRLYNLFWQ